MTQIIGLGGQKNVNFTNWDINQQYRPGDMVVYNSTIYTVTTNVPAGTPWGPAWSIAVVGGNVNFAEDANVANVANVALSVDGPNVTGIVANAAFSANAANSVYADDAGNANFANSSAALDAAGASDVKIGGGLLGQVLKSDGAGNMVWADDTATPATPDTSVQFNSGGSFGGNASFTFASGVVTMPAATVTGVTNLGAVANVRITGGNAGEFLQTDGTGNVTWTSSSATLPIANGTSQFDIPTADSDVVITANTAYDFTFGADGNLTVPGAILPEGNVLQDLGSPTQRFRDLYLANNTIYLGSDTISANAGNVTLSGNLVATRLYGAATTSITTGTVTDNAQPNITSVGILTSLEVTGNANAGNINTTNIITSGNVTIAGNLTVSGNTTQINVTDLMVQDPIIAMGGGANGANATAYDGKDRGLLLQDYYPDGSGVNNHFFGWKSTAAQFEAIANVTSTSGEVITGTAGNIAAATFIGNLSGTVLTAAQAQITSLGTLTGLTVNGESNLGAVANVKITGGSSGYALVTDGLGNLSFAAPDASLPIANGNSQFDIPLANSTVEITANGTHTWEFGNTGALTVPGTILPDANVSYDLGSATNRFRDLYLSNNTIYLGDDTISANAGNVTFGGNLVATRLYGESTTSITTGTVTTNAQPNITSVGTLTSLDVTGNANVGANLAVTGALDVTGNITTNSGVFIGDAYGLANLQGANVTGIVANANYTVYSETSLEIANGTSGIAIPVANSNIQISVNGTMIIDASDVQTSFLSNTISVNYDLNAGNRVYANSLEAGGAITASTIEAYSSITTAFFTATLGASFYDYASVGANLSVGTTLDVTDDANIGGILTAADLVVSNVANLGNVANITIIGGNAGEYLQTDGTGNLIWTTAESLPAGANTEVQFNDGGAFGAESTFTFDKVTGLVTVQDLAVTGNVTTALLPDANVTYDLGSATQRWKDLYLSNNTIYMGDDTISANAGNVTFSGTLVSTRLYGEASTAITAATVTDNAQANITSVGTLISLEVTGNTDSGNLNTGGTVIATGNITGGNIDTAGEVTATGNITGANLITSGNLEVTGQANASAFNTTLTTEQSSLNGSRMTVTVPATSTEAPTGTPTTIYTPTAGVYSYKVIVTIKHDTGGSIDIETFEVMASNGATDMLFSVSNRLNTLGSNGGLNDADVTIGNGFELSIDTKYGDTNTVTFAVTEFK